MGEGRCKDQLWNGSVVVYGLNGSGFESSCSHFYFEALPENIWEACAIWYHLQMVPNRAKHHIRKITNFEKIFKSSKRRQSWSVLENFSSPNFRNPLDYLKIMPFEDTEIQKVQNQPAAVIMDFATFTRKHLTCKVLIQASVQGGKENSQGLFYN